MTFDKTYIMVKPDGVQRGLVGRIISRFEDKGFQLLALKMTVANEPILEEHYSELKDRPFFKALMSYIGSGPVVCMCWRAKDAPLMARSIIGATDPLKAAVGTIRGDFGIVSGRNIVHGSDSPDSADKEIGLWFKEEEIYDWTPALQEWIFG
jgi:nucleoside-diphosphate kinase